MNQAATVETSFGIPQLELITILSIYGKVHETTETLLRSSIDNETSRFRVPKKTGGLLARKF